MSAPIQPMNATAGAAGGFMTVYVTADAIDPKLEARWWRWIGRGIECYGHLIVEWLMYREMSHAMRCRMFVRYTDHLNVMVARARVTPSSRAIFCYLLAEEAEDDQ